jgi:hypothetical protein
MKKICTLILLLSASVSGFAASVKKTEKNLPQPAQVATVSFVDDETAFLLPNLNQQKSKSLLAIGYGAANLSKHMDPTCLQAKELSLVWQAAGGSGLIAKALDEKVYQLTNLPVEKDSIEQAVVCYLDEVVFASCPLQEGCASMDLLEKAITSLASTLKPQGACQLILPYSHDIVFTSQDNGEAQLAIEQALAALNESFDEKKIKGTLKGLNSVYRASFVRQGDRLNLVTEGCQLKNGQTLWRKEGSRVVPTYYFSDEAYLIALAKSGLTCTEIKRPCFFGNIKHRLYHQAHPGVSLGEAYKQQAPFIIFLAQKA